MKRVLLVVLVFASLVMAACSGGGGANAVATLAPVPADRPN
jgi:hypothetical protein